MYKPRLKSFIPSFVLMAWKRISNNKTLTGIIFILIVGVIITVYLAWKLLFEDKWEESVLFPIVLMMTEVALIGVIWHLIAQTNFFRNQLAEVLYGDDIKKETYRIYRT